MTAKELIIQELEQVPEPLLEEVLDFLRFLKTKQEREQLENQTVKLSGEIVHDPTARPIWEIAQEIGAQVPDEEWSKVPTDLSKNFDHYLYGASKDDE